MDNMFTDAEAKKVEEAMKAHGEALAIITGIVAAAEARLDERV